MLCSTGTFRSDNPLIAAGSLDAVNQCDGCRTRQQATGRARVLPSQVCRILESLLVSKMSSMYLRELTREMLGVPEENQQ